ncbi:MAGE family-domain-containing protein [Plectosphaerella plurivora]|uniref:MAGE family-domain-containing protein n=1 Tax=Plectosphaerella plurivora TaxID=936078 RepID=A0A9P9AGN2_9PEZI|nr:MAGE family-domain-containing protein [Plectosphaerella plurivora]
MPPPSRRRREGDDDEDEAARPRRRPALDSDEERDMEHGMPMDSEPTVDDQLAKKLIRYAMACDYARVAIRRDGIKDKVLGEHGRAFQRVLKKAQEQLRTIWGMELRELPVREKHSLEDKRKAIKSQSQMKSSSGVYVLSTTLPDKYRSASIIGPSRAPNQDNEAAYVAFYTMIITLILLNGGELSDPKLRRYLHRLNAETYLLADPTEEVLKRMQAQGYLIRQVQRDAASQLQDGTENVVWYVGSRGQEEVGIDGASGLAREVWGEQDDEAEAEELEKRIGASFGVVRVPVQNGAAAPEAGENETPVAGPSGTNGRRRTRGQVVDDE